ncbi:hypothetical protein GCM10010232_65620 [Streptomyces amakusaensis]
MVSGEGARSRAVVRKAVSGGPSGWIALRGAGPGPGPGGGPGPESGRGRLLGDHRADDLQGAFRDVGPVVEHPGDVPAPKNAETSTLASASGEVPGTSCF